MLFGINFLMVKPLLFVAAILACWPACSLGAPDTKQPIFDVRQPTILAFFPPLTQADLNGETNEALADFQFYAMQVRKPLRRAGIEFQEVYAESFRIRIQKRVTTFRPAKVSVGYYFVAPGKKPRIEYGVMTDTGLLQIANEYFGFAVK